MSRFAFSFAFITSIEKGVVILGKKHNDYGTGIPRHEMEALARCILPSIKKYYESEEGRKAFAEWKAKRDADKISNLIDF